MKKNHKIQSYILQEKGLTLVEVMIVLAILGGLMALVAPRLIGSLHKARARQAKIQIAQITSALQNYYVDCGSYPSDLKHLKEAPSDCPSWGPEPYARKLLKDPWGREFEYRLESDNYVVICKGKDGKTGGSGYDKDISSEDI